MLQRANWTWLPPGFQRKAGELVSPPPTPSLIHCEIQKVWLLGPGLVFPSVKWVG
jgi:hypothetical protein